MNLENLISEVIGIAKLAGKRILEIYEDESLFEVESKADNSPLTRADREANDIICKGLEKLNPNIPIISEENKSIDYSKRSKFEYCWMVDPLDGTKEFIKRNGEFTVNIALIKDQTSIAGVVYAPVKNKLYYAIKGNGAYRVINENFEKIESIQFKNSDPYLKIVCSRSHINEMTQDYISQFNSPEKVATGSSLKFLIIAEGQAHIYPRLGPTMEWDTAAAQIILEESGGKMFVHESGEEMKYNKENLLNPHFIAEAIRIA